MTLKLRILRSLTRLFIILVSLTRSLFCEKMLISNRCISGLMPKLIKKSWMVSTLESLCCEPSRSIINKTREYVQVCSMNNYFVLFTTQSFNDSTLYKARFKNSSTYFASLKVNSRFICIKHARILVK